ncbi:MAG: DNA methyltransferase [Pseudomonadota bacterium]
MLDVAAIVKVNVDQFYGIEIEDFPAQIAQVAMWLMDHMMNREASSLFGQNFKRLPLEKSATIANGNALQLEWPPGMDYILGNPPFVGSKMLNEEQKSDQRQVMAAINGCGVLDYVANWYIKAAKYMSGSDIRCAFVSTNSITQGEQVGVLWGELLRLGMKIHFAHRTFQWNNEARGKAAVHCVIIGFGPGELAEKWIFDYSTPKATPTATKAANINPYLVDAHRLSVFQHYCGQ